MFPLFLKRTADVLAPRLSVVFRRLVCLGSFPVCWKQANVTPIPKSPPFSYVANFRPISLTSVLFKVFEHLVSVRLGRFTNAAVCFQPPSLLIGKVWVPVMHFCACLIHCKVHWREGRRLGSCRLISAQGFRAGILYKPCSVGIGGSVLSILTQFLSDRSQHVMVDGCRSKLVNVMSGVPQGSVLGRLLFLLYTSDLIPR